MNQIWIALFTGLTTGGLSCVAVQGGLLTSAISSQEKQLVEGGKSAKNNWKFISLFLLSKVLAYTILGGLLGLFGSFFSFSLKAQGILQIVVGLFMLATAGRILNLHPIFRYFVIAPPKQIYKMLRKVSISGNVVTPVILGVFTIFMPCGVTQMMMAGSVASGNVLSGALLLGAFVIGTSPVFFLLGMTAAKLLERPIFQYVAAAFIVYFGLTSINGGLVLSGSHYTFQNFYKAATTNSLQSSPEKSAEVANGKQNVTIAVTSSGYSADTTTLKANVPVHLKLVSKNAQGCIRGFTIPSLNLTKVIPATGEESLDFTPKNPGKLAFSCSMGMYSGEFTVVL